MAVDEAWVGAIGTVAPAVIALAGTALIQIGTWPARARRALRSDLEIVNDLPDGPERVALTDSILRRTQNLVIRANQPRFVDWLVLTRRRVVVTLLALLVVLLGMSVIADRATKASGRAAASVSPESSPGEFDAALKTIAHAQVVLTLNWIAIAMVITLGVALIMHDGRFAQMTAQREKQFPPHDPANVGPRAPQSVSGDQHTPDPEPAVPDSAATSPGDQTAAALTPSSRRERWRSRWRRLRGAW